MTDHDGYTAFAHHRRCALYQAHAPAERIR